MSTPTPYDLAVDEAIEEAKRFLDRARKWKEAQATGLLLCRYGGPERAAMIRASLDLTRALPPVRNAR